MMGRWVQSCELGGTSGEGVQWTVDDLDSGGGLMTNKIKVLRLRAMVMCLWVPYLRWVTHGEGSGESFIGSKTKLFEKVFSQEFRNLKLFFLIPGFPFFLIHRSRQKSLCKITPTKWFFENGGLLANSSVSKFVFGFWRAPDPSPARWGMQHPQRGCWGLWGILNGWIYPPFLSDAEGTTILWGSPGTIWRGE